MTPKSIDYHIMAEWDFSHVVEYDYPSETRALIQYKVVALPV